MVKTLCRMKERGAALTLTRFVPAGAGIVDVMKGPSKNVKCTIIKHVS